MFRTVKKNGHSAMHDAPPKGANAGTLVLRSSAFRAGWGEQSARRRGRGLTVILVLPLLNYLSGDWQQRCISSWMSSARAPQHNSPVRLLAEPTQRLPVGPKTGIDFVARFAPWRVVKTDEINQQRPGNECR